jgi:dihydroneopterin aldolase
MEIKEQIIALNGLRFYAYHGAEPQEAIVGAWYTVDVTIKADVTTAVESDNLNCTVNYAKVTNIIKQQMLIRSALLEHVAGRIAKSILNGFPDIDIVTITISKEHPPIGVPSATASFTLTVNK